MGIGVQNSVLTIEKVTEEDLRGITVSVETSQVQGYLEEKQEIKYEGRETVVAHYVYITLQEQGLVEKGTKVNGYIVQSIKDIKGIGGEYLYTEVIAL